MADGIAQYKTIRRLNTNYLVRCNDSLSTIIPGNGIRPASKIRRLEREIKTLQVEHGKLLQMEFVNSHKTNQHAGKAAQAKNDHAQALHEIGEQIKIKRKQVDELHLH